jgi:hypothetical protein
MKVLYKDNGEIINAVYESDWFKIDPENLNIYDGIDENVPDNIPLIRTILKSLGKKNSNGESKCYIKNDELYERKNWREFKVKEVVL